MKSKYENKTRKDGEEYTMWIQGFERIKCMAGHTGVVCGICQKDYHMSTGKLCVRCEGGGAIQPVGWVIIAFAGFTVVCAAVQSMRLYFGTGTTLDAYRSTKKIMAILDYKQNGTVKVAELHAALQRVNTEDDENTKLVSANTQLHLLRLLDTSESAVLRFKELWYVFQSQRLSGHYLNCYLKEAVPIVKTAADEWRRERLEVEFAELQRQVTVADIQGMFSFFDTDGSGKMEKNEVENLVGMLRQHGILDLESCLREKLGNSDAVSYVDFEAAIMGLGWDNVKVRQKLQQIMKQLQSQQEKERMRSRLLKELRGEKEGDASTLGLINATQTVQLNIELSANDAEEESSDEGDEFDEDFGDDPMDDLKSKLKLVVGHLQVFSSLGESISIAWPASFLFVADFFRVTRADIVAVFGIGCVLPMGYYQKLYVNFLLPIAGLGAILISYHVRRILAPHLDREDLASSHWRIVQLLLFIVYPGTALVMLQAYTCRLINGKYYLIADLSAQCYTGEWTLHALLASLGVVLYPIGDNMLVFATDNLSQLTIVCQGIQVYTATILWRNKAQLWLSKQCKRKYGLVYLRYER